MIGLNADETPGPVRRYAAHRGLGWEQWYIGSTYDPNPTEAAFGIWFPPAAFLIGPDGRILAKDLQDESIPQAVAKALEIERLTIGWRTACGPRVGPGGKRGRTIPPGRSGFPAFYEPLEVKPHV